MSPGNPIERMFNDFKYDDDQKQTIDRINRKFDSRLRS